jgi:hypothetical protein
MLLVSATTSAQEGDEWDFDNVPVDDQALPYIGVGGGYIGMVGFVNYDELNGVAGSLGLPNFDGPLLMHGGGGFTAVYFFPNVRLGIFGLAGSKEVSGDVTLNTASYKRTLRFGLGMTALQLDYAIPLVGSLIAFPGFMVGLNAHELDIMQYRNDNVGFDSLAGPTGFTTPGSDAQFNRATHMSSGSVFLYPAVNLEFALTQFFLLRLGGGYGFNFRYGDWTTNNDVLVNNVPDIKAAGPMVQFGVFIGLFQ